MGISFTPFQALATGDGNIIVAAGNDGLFQKFCATLGRPDLNESALFRTNNLRMENQPKLQHELERTLKTKTTAEWIAILEKAGVPCGPINNVAQALAHPQVAARNMVVTVDDPAAGPLRVAGNPLKFSAFADPNPASGLS